MSGFVLDASIAASWCFADEAAPATGALLDRAQHEGAAVPGLFPLEIGNLLLQAERHGRPMPGGVGTRLQLLSELPIRIDSETAARALRETVLLARTEGLTTYDAAYLELALRTGLALATKDEALMRAARRLGVPLLPSDTDEV